MSGNWIKWVKGLSRRREVIVIARKLGISRREAACACMEMWEWADDETANGYVKGATCDDIDAMLGLPGFATLLQSQEVGWLRASGQGLCFPRWDRNNGESAKRRALESRKKRRQRELGTQTASRTQRDICPDDVPVESGLDERRREETRGDPFASKGERKTNGAIGARASSRSSHSSRSPIDAFDLGGIDWDAVYARCEAVSKIVRPASEDDRRIWFKLGILSVTAFSEAWLMDAAAAAAAASSDRRNRATKQGYFVGVLKAKAAEMGTDSDTFLGMLQRIEIPTAVWKSPIMEMGG